jgi:hypothetical protein
VTTYIPGAWLAVVTPTACALIAEAPGVDSKTIADALRTRGVSGFVDSLVAATGTTVTTLPPFAIAVAEEHGMRVAVRGGATVADALNAELPAVNGAGVTGWAEALWPTTQAVRLEVAAAETGEELWIVEGAVRAQAVTWSLDDSVSVPAPVAEPAPVTETAVQPDAPAAAVSPILLTEVPPHITAPIQPPADSETVPAEATPAPDAAASATPAEDSDSEIDDVSHETLVATYDTMATQAEDAPYDTFFGALWGSDAGDESASRPPLIASVPEIGTQPELTKPEPPAPAQPEPAQPEPAQPDPAQPAPAAPTAASAPAPALGDHDGATISVAALRAMTGGGSANEAPPAVPTFATPEQLEKERRGRAVLSTGVQITLDKNIIVGRTPKASRVTGEMPHLVTVPSPSQDISRSHVEIRVEGSAVVAVDLNTTNGTVVRRGGAEPVRLHPGEPHVLLNGDIIDLGDGITITMEDLP